MDSSANIISLQGEIVTGRGTGSNRMTALAPFFKENGVEIYPGTLNVVFSKPICLDKTKADFVYNKNYYFWEATINGIKCFLYRWAHCPDHIVEIVAATKLRDSINTDNHQLVTISIEKSKTRSFHFAEMVFWNIFWRGRTKAYYENDLYAKMVSKFLNVIHRIKQ